MQARTAGQPVVAGPVRDQKGRVSGVEAVPVNLAAREAVLHAGIGEAGGDHDVRLDPRLRKGVGVEQVITCPLAPGEVLLNRLPRVDGGLERVVQMPALIAHAEAKIRGLDVIGQVQLKTVAVLVNVLQRGGESLRGFAQDRMGVPPLGGTDVAVAERVGVFEGHFWPRFRRPACFQCQLAAIQPERVVRPRVVLTCSREIAAGSVRPGALLIVGQAQITNLLPLDAEPELVVVVVNNPAPVQDQGGVGGDAGLEMEIADAAERARGDLMLLLELGAVAADKGLPGREINPVVVGVGVRPRSSVPGSAAAGCWCPPQPGRRRRKGRAAMPNTTGLVPCGMRAVISWGCFLVRIAGTD